MTGAGKLAARLIAAIIMLTALRVGAQQPSNVDRESRSNPSTASASVATHAPAEMPPNPPKVNCEGDKLSISAQNSTLGAVLNAIRACTGAQIDVPEDARGERLFAELGPGPLRTVLADFLSSTDFNYVIKASPSDPQKIQMVLLNPRTGDAASEVATVADKSTGMTSNRRGWLKARENYMQSFTAARDDSNQEADAPSSASVEATTPAADAAPVETTAPAASPAQVEATAPAASAAAAGASSPAASSVPLPAEPANPGMVASPESPAPAASPVPSTGTDPIASTSPESDMAPAQDNKTEQMISNMQRMFEQRKQMMQQQQQQQQTSVPQP